MKKKIISIEVFEDEVEPIMNALVDASATTGIPLDIKIEEKKSAYDKAVGSMFAARVKAGTL